MSYVVTIPVVFPHPRAEVYEALCDVGSYPLWNSGMKSVSNAGPLKEGLRYQTETLMNGRINQSDIEVTKLVQAEEIELVCYSGLVAYQGRFLLHDHEGDGTEVVCSLRFEFRNFVLDLARPVIEAMAEARVRGDLETLRALLSGRPSR